MKVGGKGQKKHCGSGIHKLMGPNKGRQFTENMSGSALKKKKKKPKNNKKKKKKKKNTTPPPTPGKKQKKKVRLVGGKNTAGNSRSGGSINCQAVGKNVYVRGKILGSMEFGYRGCSDHRDWLGVTRKVEGWDQEQGLWRALSGGGTDRHKT